jgi:hypothetical protein
MTGMTESVHTSAAGRWPIYLAIAAYWTACLAALVLSIRRNDGHLIYPLDDAYVHMSMAKNVALHHVWGVTPYAFASSTSSPLWTLLLAGAYAAFGVNAYVPLIVNLAAGTLVIVAIGRIMLRRSARGALTFVVLTAAVFITPLPTLTFLGMEHTLHALATLCFAFVAASLLASPTVPARHELLTAGLLSALVTGFRYEGAFAVAIVVLLFILRGRLIAAAVVGAMGALPIVVYGLWSEWHGWYFLPNSVLLKGHAPALQPMELLRFLLGSPALHNLVVNPPILIMVVAALAVLVLIIGSSVSSDHVFLLAILVGTTLLHMELARSGWFYRYEAYLLVLGVTVFGVIAADRLPMTPAANWPTAVARYSAVFMLAAIGGYPFASRAVNAWRNIAPASGNIYRQQYQMGTFLDRFYRGQSIAVNDIGAVTFLADVRVLDIFGLGNLDMARLKLGGRYASDHIAASAQQDGAEIAIIYPSWLGEFGGVPARWVRVGEWTVRDNIVLGESSVSFYAVHDGARSRLVDSLRQFAPNLPPDVVQAGEYTR